MAKSTFLPTTLPSSVQRQVTQQAFERIAPSDGDPRVSVPEFDRVLQTLRVLGMASGKRITESAFVTILGEVAKRGCEDPAVVDRFTSLQIAPTQVETAEKLSNARMAELEAAKDELSQVFSEAPGFEKLEVECVHFGSEESPRES